MDDIFKFNSCFPYTPRCPFRPANPLAEYMATDSGVIDGSYFYAYSSALTRNVPIPGHPDLTNTEFYSDMAYLFDVSSLYQSPESLRHVTEKQLHEQLLHSDFTTLQQIRSALGSGKSVVVHECSTYPKPSQVGIQDPEFISLVGHPDCEIFVQDLLKWPKVATETIQRYHDSMDDPRTLYNILELNGYSRLHRPNWISCLYDDSSLLLTDRIASAFTHTDNIRTHSWMLWGQPFSYTLLHQDTVGYSTFISVSKGVKLWFVLEWTCRPEPSDWSHRFDNLVQRRIWCLEYRLIPPWVIEKDGTWTFDREIFDKMHPEWEVHRVARWVVVILREGTTLVMPPATPHAVYNVSEAFTVGGHGLFWEGLPLTEIGCRMDNLSDSISNDVHGAMLHSLTQFALSLPQPNSASEVPEKPSRLEIESLARIILQPGNYRQAQSDSAKPDIRYKHMTNPKTHSQAKDIMRHYAQLLEISVPVVAEEDEEDFTWATRLPSV
ncbi:hypothetical protein FRB90_002100 [Tulasnella sp. 427]|nr:hypothetical protein FRB90_002100 [Tulasnella sp. 427]